MNRLVAVLSLVAAAWSATTVAGTGLVQGLSEDGMYPREMFVKVPLYFMPCTPSHAAAGAALAAIAVSFEGQGWTIQELSADFLRALVCQGGYCQSADAFLTPSGIVELWRTPGQDVRRGPELRWLRNISSRYEQNACLQVDHLSQVLRDRRLPAPSWTQLSEKEIERARRSGQYLRWIEWRERASAPKTTADVLPSASDNLSAPATATDGTVPATRRFRSPLKCSCGGTIVATVSANTVVKSVCEKCGGSADAHFEGDRLVFTLKVVGIPRVPQAGSSVVSR